MPVIDGDALREKLLRGHTHPQYQKLRDVVSSITNVNNITQVFDTVGDTTYVVVITPEGDVILVPVSALPVRKELVFFISGTLSTASGGKIRIHAPCPLAVLNVTATVATAPTGASLIVDVHKNGTTIFTTQGNRPTITSGNQNDTSSTPDVTAIAEDDIITVDVDQVGSTVAGADLLVQVRCEVDS